ncbi:MAG: glycosyltransferase family 4 protein [Pirellulaceae bacterium]|nr:glycosyltransferase family 4 protein [Pirellulaceae bacterium]
MQISYLTAGAAGMFCGSCLHDNALAKSLMRLGHDVILLPTYTPILTDETSVSSDRLFFGGLNVYLQQVSPIFRWIPKWMDQFLSSPRLVNWIASRAMGTSAKQLGALTVSMLQGSDGRQRKEVSRLCDWLVTQKPDVAIFSNLLIAGCIREVKSRIGCPVVVMLQGDDIFYEGLIEPYRSEALKLLKRLAQDVDLFIVHSDFYGQRMQQLLEFPRERWQVNTLAIEPSDFLNHQPVAHPDARTMSPTVGYLARLAPEKGLHQLVDAFIELRKRLPKAQLAIAGWLGKQHESYWQEQQDKLASAGLADAYTYHGSVDRAGKLKFLEAIDVLCVPTTYQEPKGLFVLEALAAGVPVVQPAHGAFPELIDRLGGGHLFVAGDRAALVDRLEMVLSDLPAAQELGQAGRAAVLKLATTDQAAARLVDMLNPLVAKK